MTVKEEKYYIVYNLANQHSNLNTMISCISKAAK